VPSVAEASTGDFPAIRAEVLTPTTPSSHAPRHHS
jgi:hypothetical protein